jgi:hypothetical protein
MKAMHDDMDREAAWQKGLTPATKRLDEIAVELKAGDLPLTKDQHQQLAKAAAILDDLTAKPWSAR